MRIAVAVLPNGMVNAHFGRASKMALADVENGAITKWEEIDAPFAEMHGDHHHHHGAGHQPSPTHQSTIKNFLVEQNVNVVLVHHAGPGLQKVKDDTDIEIVAGAQGNAREAVEELLKHDSFSH